MLLGFSTMNANKVTDYTCRKQLEELNNDLKFLNTVFEPNIDEATRNLQDLPNYKERQKTPADIETSIKIALGNIKKDWIEDDQQYNMYKNIVDTYFALESAYLDKFKLEEQLEQKERVTQTADGDLNRELKIRDGFAKDNESLKLEIRNLNSDIKIQQSLAESRKRELGNCRDSLKRCMRDLKAFRQR
ncbi:MAG: hypothetical protein A2Y71_07815 [Bacteroidetes bacterium RBG_13_42_15]|jgi:hypothetical protein|nr:MAG: hypothetical protein A2Y71_07815 [Bacteroidetes bacterium RBG_13_42_15]